MNKQYFIPDKDGFYGFYYSNKEKSEQVTLAMCPCDFIMEGFYQDGRWYSRASGLTGTLKNPLTSKASLNPFEQFLIAFS